MSASHVTRAPLATPCPPCPELDALVAHAQAFDVVSLVEQAFALGVQAARMAPVCDWCASPVVADDLGWCHKDTGFYGCEPEGLWDHRAQVNGRTSPAGAR